MERKEKPENAKCPTQSKPQALLKLVLRIYRLHTLDGGSSEEVKRWKAVFIRLAQLKVQMLSHFINRTHGCCW